MRFRFRVDMQGDPQEQNANRGEAESYCFCPELVFGHTGLANSIRHTGPS